MTDMVFGTHSFHFIYVNKTAVVLIRTKADQDLFQHLKNIFPRYCPFKASAHSLCIAGGPLTLLGRSTADMNSIPINRTPMTCSGL